MRIQTMYEEEKRRNRNQLECNHSKINLHSTEIFEDCFSFLKKKNAIYNIFLWKKSPFGEGA